MATTTENGRLTPGEVASLIIGVLSQSGELTTEEIVEAVKAEQAEVDEQIICRQVIRLDRQGVITRQNQEAGWQITSRGRDSLESYKARKLAPIIVPYGSFTWFRATYQYVTPALGPETGPGGAGKSVFPRMPDGRVIFRGGWIRAALQKALNRVEATVVTLSGPRAIPKATWDHVAVRTVLLPADTKLVDRVRRPVNVQGQAIGEIIHEALPEGTILEVQALFPLSHFPEPVLRQMFEMAGVVGISPAGSGKGGVWGVAELLNFERESDQARSGQTGTAQGSTE